MQLCLAHNNGDLGVVKQCFAQATAKSNYTQLRERRSMYCRTALLLCYFPYSTWCCALFWGHMIASFKQTVAGHDENSIVSISSSSAILFVAYIVLLVLEGKNDVIIMCDRPNCSGPNFRPIFCFSFVCTYYSTVNVHKLRYYFQLYGKKCKERKATEPASGTRTGSFIAQARRRISPKNVHSFSVLQPILSSHQHASLHHTIIRQNPTSQLTCACQ